MKKFVVFPEASIEVFKSHELQAFILIIFVQIQVFWRLGSEGKIPGKFTYLYFILTLASLTSVILTSYYGGNVVFEHGVGVKSTKVDIEKNIKTEKKKSTIQFVKPDTLIN